MEKELIYRLLLVIVEIVAHVQNKITDQVTEISHVVQMVLQLYFMHAEEA